MSHIGTSNWTSKAYNILICMHLTGISSELFLLLNCQQCLTLQCWKIYEIWLIQTCTFLCWSILFENQFVFLFVKNESSETQGVFNQAFSISLAFTYIAKTGRVSTYLLKWGSRLPARLSVHLSYAISINLIVVFPICQKTLTIVNQCKLFHVIV